MESPYDQIKYLSRAAPLQLGACEPPTSMRAADLDDSQWAPLAPSHKVDDQEAEYGDDA